MLFTDQLTNSKGREDHVASGTHKRANIWAPFSRRTALKLMLLKGAMLHVRSRRFGCTPYQRGRGDYVNGGISEQISRLRFCRRTAVNLMLLKGAMLCTHVHLWCGDLL